MPDSTFSPIGICHLFTVIRCDEQKQTNEENPTSQNKTSRSPTVSKSPASPNSCDFPIPLRLRRYNQASRHPLPDTMSKKKQASTQRLNEVLDDLCMRFLVNLPAVEYESFERLFFAIESAHWFYDDFYRETDKSLPRLQLKQFASKLFKHTALLQHYHDDVDRLTAQFQSYKQEVPTCGAALLNPAMDKVVVVRAWGQNARWGFPRGKLSKDETELDAAVREVFEETGFDMGPYVDETTPYVDSMSGGRYSRIFIVTDVSEHTVFETRTRKEISDIKWVSLSALPESPKAAKVQQKVILTSSGPQRTEKVQKIFFSQYGVAPYTKRVMSWIQRRKKKLEENGQGTPVSAEELEKTLLVQSSKTITPSTATAVDSQRHRQVLSVAELEATLMPQNPNTGTVPRGARSMAKPPDASAKEVGRKSRRKAGTSEHHEEVLNRTTFGMAAGSRMDDSEREKLFRQYVIETDRIAAEKGLRDEFWPVPYITSKDFTAEELEAAERSRANKASGDKETVLREVAREVAKELFPSMQGRNRDLTNGWTVRNPLIRAKEDAFVFDRDAIMASLNAYDAI